MWMKNPAPVPSREFAVDGRVVRVWDSLLADVGEYVQGLSRAAFTRTEFAHPDSREFKHRVNEVRLPALQQQPILALTLGAVSGFATPHTSYRPYRAYTNASTFGDMLFTHTDCLPEQHDLTALWYLCDAWDREWGGETVFYDDRDEIACAVAPKPGRLVVFDGAIRHAGRPPSRICPATRFTFAIKFERIAAASAS